MKRLMAAGALLAAAIAALAAAEIVARVAEPRSAEEGNTTPVADRVAGWLPRPGIVHVRSQEFSAEYNVNDLHMNDRRVTDADCRLPRRILALGDSHTFGVGVSWNQAWPIVLDGLLFGNERPREGRVFNGGVAAYSLGQYLQRYRMLRSTLSPQIVLVGVSTATDLFDLLPPRLGGFVYGGDAERDYFDLDGSGALVEEHFAATANSTAPAAAFSKSGGLRVRTWLRKFSLYRRLQTSMLAMRLATSIKLPGGDPLWEGPDAVLRADLDDREKFQWKLAEAILAELVKEARADGATVTLVLIPYLPEVYDDVWSSTFGRSSEFDRSAGSRRMRELAARIGAGFVDTTPALAAAARASGRWLHFRVDKHPTAEGHQVIARAVMASLRP